MPACWVTSSIVTVDGVNKPKVATLRDLGRVIGGDNPFFAHSSAIYPERNKTWCLSYVVGEDFSTIDADPDCDRVFDEVLSDRDGKPPTRAANTIWLNGISTTSKGRLNQVLTRRQADETGLDTLSSRTEWLQSLGKSCSGDIDFRPQGWHTL